MLCVSGCVLYILMYIWGVSVHADGCVSSCMWVCLCTSAFHMSRVVQNVCCLYVLNSWELGWIWGYQCLCVWVCWCVDMQVIVYIWVCIICCCVSGCIFVSVKSIKIIYRMPQCVCFCEYLGVWVYLCVCSRVDYWVLVRCQISGNIYMSILVVVLCGDEVTGALTCLWVLYKLQQIPWAPIKCEADPLFWLWDVDHKVGVPIHCKAGDVTLKL